MPDLASAKKFQFVGGNLALDFCNTVGGKRGAITRDYLNSYFDLIAWCYQAGLLDGRQAQECLEVSERQTERAASVLERAIQFREALFRMFAALIARKPVPQAELAALNAELSSGLGRRQLLWSRNGNGFKWTWAVEPGVLDQALGQIAHAAATLLTDPEHLKRAEICHGDTCGWLFVDLSKNHSRRWCDMRDCGNRAKVRRHRQRLRRE